MRLWLRRRWQSAAGGREFAPVAAGWVKHEVFGFFELFFGLFKGFSGTLEQEWNARPLVSVKRFSTTVQNPFLKDFKTFLLPLQHSTFNFQLSSNNSGGIPDSKRIEKSQPSCSNRLKSLNRVQLPLPSNGL